MYMHIENDISFPSPEADIEFVEVPGRDGELVVDNNRLKGMNFPVPVRLKLPPKISVNETSTKISEWLKTDVGWYPLRFSGSEEYEYIALCYEQFDIAETLKNYGKTVINFRLKPYKRKIGVSGIELKSGQSIINQSKRASKPFIRVEGTGDITLRKNGEDWLILTSVEDYIHIDSEAMSVWRETGRRQFKKMNSTLTPMFPLLESGENKITWTGDVSKVVINPRWEVVT